MATDFKHRGPCPEVPVAEAQCCGGLLQVQPYVNHSGVCTERRASGCRKDEEVPSETGDSL